MNERVRGAASRRFWIGLAFAAAFPLWACVAGRSMVFLGDALHYTYPSEAMLGRVLAADPAHLPRWNPWAFGGSPLLADPQRQAWYPPALLFRFLPFAPAWGAFLALHAALAVLGMAAFVLAEGLGTGPAALAGIGYGLGAFASFQLAESMTFPAFAWLPWVAVLARRTRERGRTADAVALGLAGAWLALAGYPPLWFHAAVIAGVVLWAGRPGRSGGRGPAVAAGVALAATAAMLVPFLAYLSETTRGVTVGAEAGMDSIPPGFLTSLIAPYALFPFAPSGQLGWPEFRYTLHFPGVLVTAFAAAAVVWRFRPGGGPRPAPAAVRAAAVLVGLGIVLGLGENLPVAGPWLLATPPFSFLRHPGVWMGTAGGFGLAWLAALGADSFERRLLTGAGWTAVAGFAGAAVFFGSLGGFARLGGAWYASHWGVEAARFGDRLAACLHPSLLLSAASIVFWLVQRREIRGKSAALLAAVVLTWMDLVAFQRNDLVQPTARSAWLTEPGAEELALARLAAGAPGSRILVAPPHDLDQREDAALDTDGPAKGIARLRTSLRSDLPAVAGLRNAWGYGSLKPASVAAAYAASSRAPLIWDRSYGAALRDLGVRWVVARRPIPGAPVAPVLKGAVAVYAVAGARGPAWVEPGTAGRVDRAVEEAPGVWSLTGRMDRPGTVVLGETWVRGWRSDRPDVAVGPVRGLVIGAAVPDGPFRLRLAYDPPEIRWSLVVSALALAGLLVAALRASLSARR